MRILVIGDLHGNIPNLHFKSFDAIIAPGDFCSDKAGKYMFQALKERMNNSSSKINWYDIVGRKKAKEMILKSLKDGRKVLEKLNNLGVPVYIVPGNWDWTPNEDSEWGFLTLNHYENLIKGLENIKDVHNKIIDIDEFEIIGHGITSGPEYPRYSQDRVRFTKKELLNLKKEFLKKKRKIKFLFNKSKKPIILLSHNVPFNTPLDQIVNKKSPRNGQHFGSLIAREIIDECQPVLCVGGHMHEHFGKCKLGKTIVINSGFGSNVNIFIETNNGNIRRLNFYGKKHIY